MVKDLSTKPKRKLLPCILGICALVGAYVAADTVILGATTTPANAWGRGWGGGGWGGRGWGGRGWGGRGWGGGWGYRRGWGPGWGGGGWGGGPGCWWWNGWTWVSRCW